MVHNESKHPLVKHKLGELRAKQTDSRTFRRLLRELGSLLAYEVSADLPTTNVEVESPLGRATDHVLSGKIGLFPILRSGLTLVDGMIDMFGEAEVWHLGLYRDQGTLCPVEYYNKLPPKARVDTALVLDPLLATGGTAVAAVSILKNWGVKNIRFVCVLAAPDGLANFADAHPDVPVYVGNVEAGLNADGLIVPGLGDAGDRMFNTL